jgi:hypothetical protein
VEAAEKARAAEKGKLGGTAAQLRKRNAKMKAAATKVRGKRCLAAHSGTL